MLVTRLTGSEGTTFSGAEAIDPSCYRAGYTASHHSQPVDNTALVVGCTMGVVGAFICGALLFASGKYFRPRRATTWPTVCAILPTAPQDDLADKDKRRKFEQVFA